MANSLTYKSAGVHLHAAQQVVEDIARLRGRTEKKRRLFGAFGSFASAFDLSGYREPVILTTCDGIGTKIMPLIEQDQLEIAGIDLVAMNVNDILALGAQPILFLDYIGIGIMDRHRISRLIEGMTQALEGCDCILAGGETAEMPDLVHDPMVELAGFCVGVIEKSEWQPADQVKPGDLVLGLPSNGFHANGWSLIRRVLAAHAVDFTSEDLRSLLAPTRIYHREVMQLKQAGITPKSMAHITGGGLPENLPRVLSGHGARLSLPPWNDPAVQKVLNRVDAADRLNAFNMGIGWTIVLAPAAVDAVVATLPEAKVLGEVIECGMEIEVTPCS